MSEMLSPEGAEIYVEQDLFDAANPDGVMAVSIHKKGNNSHCNIWLKHHNEWFRLIDERILEESEPSWDMARGELLRLGFAKRDEINDDLRLKLAVVGLSLSITSESDRECNA